MRLLVLISLLIAGCATPGISTYQQQLDRNQAVQDCILGGGHPHLGPADTIICD